jgi:hypothetical protein
MSASQASRRGPITDSPWFWFYLFATAGLIALVLMGPRFTGRQVQIERQYQARERAMQKQLGQAPTEPLSDEGHTIHTLRPLYVGLGAVLIVAWVVLWWRHFRTAARPVPPAHVDTASHNDLRRGASVPPLHGKTRE